MFSAFSAVGRRSLAKRGGGREQCANICIRLHLCDVCAMIIKYNVNGFEGDDWWLHDGCEKSARIDRHLF